MRFREEHVARVEAINAHAAATKAQTSLLDALFSEAKKLKQKVDRLCLHAARFEKIEGDVTAITNSVQDIDNKTHAISSFVSSLSERVDGIGLVFEHKANETRKVEAVFFQEGT